MAKAQHVAVVNLHMDLRLRGKQGMSMDAHEPLVSEAVGKQGRYVCPCCRRRCCCCARRQPDSSLSRRRRSSSSPAAHTYLLGARHVGPNDVLLLALHMGKCMAVEHKRPAGPWKHRAVQPSSSQHAVHTHMLPTG